MECPLLALVPIRSADDYRTIQMNFERITEWSRQMCAYAGTLEDRIAALEP